MPAAGRGTARRASDVTEQVVISLGVAEGGLVENTLQLPFKAQALFS